MITFLSKLLIPNYENTASSKVRQSYGILCGAIGIFLNLLLFSGKFFAGILSNSIAILSDAFNNLSDAGSSIITLIGFKMAGQKPDPEHPFGHGRIEYVSGLLVSVAILLMSAELLKSSVLKIFHPEETLFNSTIAAILLVSVVVKLYMAYYNNKIGKQIGSPTVEAAAMDSISDCLATTMVLLSSVFTHFTGIIIDGWCGVLVALFILYAGLSAARDTISPLLGQPPARDFVDRIEEIVTSYDCILGIHDLLVHNYGPGRIMVSLHAEVPASGDILELHDTIDLIEHRLAGELECEAVIHMDPILNDDVETKEYKTMILDIIGDIDPALSIHDFRIVKGPTHTNLIFDIVVPYHFALSDNELRREIECRVQLRQSSLFTVIDVDRFYL